MDLTDEELRKIIVDDKKYGPDCFLEVVTKYLITADKERLLNE